MERILVGLFTGLKGRVQIFVVIQIMAGVQQSFMIGFQTAVIIVLVSDTVGQQIAAAAFVRGSRDGYRKNRFLPDLI